MTIQSIDYTLSTPKLAYSNLKADDDYVITARDKEQKVYGADVVKALDRFVNGS